MKNYLLFISCISHWETLKIFLKWNSYLLIDIIVLDETGKMDKSGGVEWSNIMSESGLMDIFQGRH